MHVEPTGVREFGTEMQALEIATRQRDGNLSYDAVVDDPLAGRFLVAERWRDQAALTAHFQAPDTIAFVGRWLGRMRGDIFKYNASDERGLMNQ